jgi:hypothetical protein
MSGLLWLLLSILAADPAATPAAGPDPASLEKRIAEAPGKVGCESSASAVPDPACRERQEGLDAFRDLYALDKARAIAALQKRFDEIPSPRGGYFPILAAARVKDRAFLPPLRKVAESQRENDLGTFASEAARLIETGRCSEAPPSPRLREICR